MTISTDGICNVNHNHNKYDMLYIQRSNFTEIPDSNNCVCQQIQDRVNPYIGARALIEILIFIKIRWIQTCVYLIFINPHNPTLY